MDVGTIISGVSADNVPYLKLFLIDYKREFNVEVVNASCQKCINQYHKDFIKKFSPMESNSQYKLLSKREGIPLEFGSNIFVTNKNITDEYAEKLIQRFTSVKADFKLCDLFEIYPVEMKKNAHAVEITEEPITPSIKDSVTKKQRSKKRK